MLTQDIDYYKRINNTRTWYVNYYWEIYYWEENVLTSQIYYNCSSKTKLNNEIKDLQKEECDVILDLAATSVNTILPPMGKYKIRVYLSRTIIENLDEKTENWRGFAGIAQENWQELHNLYHACEIHTCSLKKNWILLENYGNMLLSIITK